MQVEWKSVDELIAALESGEYKKGKNFLKDRDGGYCCLGVLCKISGLSDEDILNGDTEDAKNRHMYITLRDNSLLAWGAIDEGPAWLDSDQEDQLGVTNDRSNTWEPVIEHLKEIKAGRR